MKIVEKVLPTIPEDVIPYSCALVNNNKVIKEFPNKEYALAYLSLPIDGELPDTVLPLDIESIPSNCKATSFTYEVMENKVVKSYTYRELSKKEIKDSKISKGIWYKDLNYQIDDKARSSIASKILQMQLDSSIDTVVWISNTKDALGEDIKNTFTREEFFDFVKQVAVAYENVVLNKE